MSNAYTNGYEAGQRAASNGVTNPAGSTVMCADWRFGYGAGVRAFVRRGYRTVAA